MYLIDIDESRDYLTAYVNSVYFVDVSSYSLGFVDTLTTVDAHTLWAYMYQDFRGGAK